MLADPCSGSCSNPSLPIRILIVALFLSAEATAQSPQSRLADFLRKDVALTAAQWQSVDRGEVVVKALPSGDRTDIVVIGIMRVARAPATIIRDARGTGGATTRSVVHPFGTPAALSDVASLRFNRDELSQFASCRPSSCNQKMSVADMTALKAIVSPGTPVAYDHAQEY